MFFNGRSSVAKGSCLCGVVRWGTSDDLTPPSHCHCLMCRKAHGAPFASFTSCAKDEFDWISGEGNVGQFISSPDLVRRFCKTCGSSVPGSTKGNGRVFLPLGCMDVDPGLRDGRHLFIGSKAPWHTIADQLEKHDTYPLGPGMHSDLPVFEAPKLSDPKPGTLRGSCLCGQVAYEVDEPFSVVHNCHCSRCRKARGAAHATNGFVSLDAFRFVKGEELVTYFKLSNAVVFGQAFCSNCGSAVPRRNIEGGVVNVPLGPLDDKPDTKPSDHIFVASKADWYEIADDILQFEEGPN
ncbi:MAG: GFA family protein [Hyphomicrobiales bacterium]